MAVRISAVVLTLGRSPLLIPCLEALRREGGSALEIILVDQGEAPSAIPDGFADRILRPGRNLGFAAGNNLGIAESSGDRVALVNDDAVVEPGWLGALADALEADPGAAAAQGVNVRLGEPGICDGRGLGWNRWWQAVQLGFGDPVPDPAPGIREVFGVSATAALFRREALREIAPGGEVFDPRLFLYYEDVDLAARMRAGGWRALLVPAARAGHAGSISGRTIGRDRWRFLYGNRYLAAARLLGRSFWPRLPWMALRDLADLVRSFPQRERFVGILAGWGRAVRLLPGFARRGAPAVPLGEIHRFR
jgi:hypothetical protein